MLKGVGSVRPQAVRGFGDEMVVGGGIKLLLCILLTLVAKSGG